MQAAWSRQVQKWRRLWCGIFFCLIPLGPSGAAARPIEFRIIEGEGKLRAIESPRAGFRDSPIGVMALAKNGLFLFPEELPEPATLLERVTANALQPYGSGFLVATDGGLFALSFAGGVTTKERVIGYRRSVRDIYRISDIEYFVATQDGLAYFDRNDMKTLGPNVQVDRILGSPDGETVMCITDPERLEDRYELGNATSVFVDYHACPGAIENALLHEGTTVVASDLGLFLPDETGFHEPVKHGAIHDLLSFGGQLLVAADDGLFRFDLGDGEKLVPHFEKLIDGKFGDLSAAAGLACAMQDGIQIFLDPDLSIVEELGIGGITRCHAAREILGQHFFCTDAGVITIIRTGEALSSSFTSSQEEVFDVARHQDRLLLATAGGVRLLEPIAAADTAGSPGSGGVDWKWAGVGIGGLGVLSLVAVLLRRRALPRVFLSYRRVDSEIFVGRIYDHLHREFGKSRVILDKNTFGDGQDFRREIEAGIAGSDVVVAVIGDDWDGGTTEAGQRRIDDPGDFVRIELEIAHRLGKPILPVLLMRTPMPEADSLPESLNFLAYRNAIRMRTDPDFESDCQQMVGVLKELKRRGSEPGQP